MTIAAGSFPAAGGRSAGSLWVATGRAGGYSTPPFDGFNLADYLGDDPDAVARNLALAASLIGVDRDHLAILEGVHGARVALVDTGGTIPGVDGLVSTTPDLALMARAADCVPVVMADPDRGVVAAVHCGWRGLVAGIVGAAIGVMREVGAGRISAVIGPSICAQCYPVPHARVDEVLAGVSPAAAVAACPPDCGSFIDVGAGVRQQLMDESVVVEQISMCTAESPELFSYRRDGLTGRQSMIVRL